MKAEAVAKLLKVSRREVYSLARRGALATRRVGNAMIFNRRDVLEYRRLTTPVSAKTFRPRELRAYERARQELEAVGVSMDPLTEAEQALAERRYRRVALAPWADPMAVRAIYDEARRLSDDTGIPHHVDHIIPLLGEFVSGLHVETNLRVIPWIDNIRKRNKVDPC